MKKLVLLSLIGILLTGCGEDKITKENLVGEWTCEREIKFAYWRDGKFGDYNEPIIVKNQAKYFKLEGDVLYFSSDNNEWGPSIDMFLNKKIELDDSPVVKILRDVNVKYVSDDNYIFNYYAEHYAKARYPEDTINTKIKGIDNCTRIK